jgi:hypothetical protein
MDGRVCQDQSGTAGRFYVGTTIGMLTGAQLSQIQFTGYTGTAIILIGTGK